MNNKKGTSIIELIVSIALLSIILAFMLKLLVDLNNVRTNTRFAKDNQIVRSEIIRTIENDLKNKNIVDIESQKNGDSLSVTFRFDSGSAQMIVSPTNLSYKKSNNNIRKWTMKDCELYTDKIYINKISASSSNSCAFILNVQVFTSHKDNSATKNNPLDDIQISYFNNNGDCSSIGDLQ